MSAHLASVGPTVVDHSVLIPPLPVHIAPSSLPLLFIETDKKSLRFLLTPEFCFLHQIGSCLRTEAKRRMHRAASQQKDLSILDGPLAFDIHSLSPYLLLDNVLFSQSMCASATFPVDSAPGVEGTGLSILCCPIR